MTTCATCGEAALYEVSHQDAEGRPAPESSRYACQTHMHTEAEALRAAAHASGSPANPVPYVRRLGTEAKPAEGNGVALVVGVDGTVLMSVCDKGRPLALVHMPAATARAVARQMVEVATHAEPPPLSEVQLEQVKAALANAPEPARGTVKRLEDAERGWTAGIGAVNGKVSVTMEDIAAESYWWDMTPEKARDFAHTLLAALESLLVPGSKDCIGGHDESPCGEQCRAVAAAIRKARGAS